MKILVLGAGAIGGYYGARLIEAGANVTFLVRAQRAARLREHGLSVKSELGSFHQQVSIVTEDQITAPADAIVLTCKAYDLEAAMDAIAPAVGKNTVILPFLNGLAAYDRLDQRFGKQHVIGGIAYIATMLAPDDSIIHYGTGDITIIGARSPDNAAVTQQLHQLLSLSQGKRVLSDNIDQALWNKWVAIATGALMTSLMRGTVGQILATQDGRALFERAIAECSAVAQASGFTLPPEATAQMNSMFFDTASGWAASMARDINAGIKKIEADDIVGDMVRRAGQFGHDTPLARTAYCHLQVYQQQQQ